MAAARGATKCGPTCCTRTRWSRTCAPTTRSAIPREYWTETSTGSSKRESGGATGEMTNSTVLALSFADRWHGFWSGTIGDWILARGVPIALYLIGGLLAARFITWLANRIVRRIDADFHESDQLVRSESAKYRQAVISWVSIAVLFVIVAVQVTDILQIPVGSLVAPAAVLGAALGFGAQRIVQDLLSGFFIITE